MSVSPTTQQVVKRPLPPGAVIEFCGDHAVVVHDDGGDSRLTVELDGQRHLWWWTFEGASCSVVSMPETLQL